MGTSMELKKRDLAELKRKSDKIKAEIKADEEKHGIRLSLTCFDIVPTDKDVMIMPNVSGSLFIAKTEIGRLVRFVGILKERYGG